MRQSRRMSLVEAVANVVVGYGIAVLAQVVVFPWFGLHATLAENMTMGALFTVVSILRSYSLRRLFDLLTNRSSVGDIVGNGTERTDRVKGI